MAAGGPTRRSFEDLAVWRISLPGIEHAVLPPSTDRPNPRLSNGTLFVSVFSPGSVYALDAATGKICWRRELPYLGGSATELAGDLLFAQTAQSLYALDPTSGSIRWQFCPYSPEGETLYSSPVLHGTRLFIGDRLGWLHCLCAETGQTIWKRLTSDHSHRDVNATATVVAGLVITATNAGLALAYSVEDGQPVWRCKLDGPCTNHLFLFEKLVVAAAESLHFLEPTTGELQDRVHWSGLRVAFAAGSSSQVALFRRPSSGESSANELLDQDRADSETLLLFEGTRALREIQCSGYASAVRFSRATGLLYVSGLMGLDILDPQTGEWMYTIRSAEENSGYGLPEVTENKIYCIDGSGAVSALQHPRSTV
jgi:outer membrane protein assembly factor BamB